jgi:5-formyltetrahydrofolate cyclo-ligase
MTKQDLRATLRERRKTLGNPDSFTLAESDEADALLARSRVIGGYVAMAYEADPARMLAKWADRGKLVALPWFAGRTATMQFRRWIPGESLEKAVFSFFQPTADAPLLAPDLLLVPLVGFDRRGNRIGQGAGHYDRYFSLQINALKIGVAFEFQELTACPADPWDVPLDAIWTDREWIAIPDAKGIR